MKFNGINYDLFSCCKDQLKKKLLVTDKFKHPKSSLIDTLVNGVNDSLDALKSKLETPVDIELARQKSQTVGAELSSSIKSKLQQSPVKSPQPQYNPQP
jgi:hypothetical protein